MIRISYDADGVGSKISTMDTAFSYLHFARKDNYRYESIPQIIRREIERNKDVEAFVHYKQDGSRESITFSELNELGNKFARYLASRGIKRGDSVALFGLNSINWIIAQMGIVSCGAVTVHVNLASSDVTSVCEIFSLVNCKAFCVDPGPNGQYQNAISGILNFMQLQTDCVNLEDSKPNIVFLRKDKTFEGYPPISEILESNLGSEIQLPTLFPEDAVLILATSGSSGKPKLVEHTHFNVANVDIRYLFTQAEKGTTKLFNDRPFGWVGGTPLADICIGQTRIFVDTSMTCGGDSTQRVWDIIRTEQCHSAVLLPYLLDDLLKMKDKNQDSFKLKRICTGGQVVKSKFLQVIGTFCEQLAIGYVSTETFGISVVEIGTSDWEETVGNVGKPFPGVEVKIIDGSGNVTQISQPGEICIRSPYLFKRYLANDEANKRAFTDRGWFRIGDTGYISKKRNIIIQGRTKDIITRGTRKIIPESVENIIQKMHGLSQVVVIGVPDERLHEEVCACFTADDNCSTEPEDVQQFCDKTFFVKESLDGIGLMPKYFLKFNEFPKLSNGKPDKIKLKENVLTRLFPH